ncbi:MULTISPECIES: hypothetical protein [Collimonas]|jgi:hypothetical protein|uniref:Membrane protein n=1 Tax=Collimonas pratensis TaxID=279113 RepID=A0A127R1N0_9BURK|nr:MULTISPECIES: hypothetical protein [Collimonas]AMP06392.1 putative membrane protein [Collimonas pratensis]AMP16268.1 putative membrane protein [Collimonas pratensis]NKI70600.1 hypothetical protein [Collimonas pratensis]HWX01484.1 hypothetical protein [Collimonas sp.]
MFNPIKNHNLSQHILPSSATMIGVCITALSIIKLARFSGLAIWLSHLLALNSLVFLTSGVLSYASMRSRQSTRLEQYADIAFIFGLTLLSLSTVFMAVVID